MSRKTPSAVGERQMFPMHTNRTLITVRFPDAFPGTVVASPSDYPSQADREDSSGRRRPGSQPERGVHHPSKRPSLQDSAGGETPEDRQVRLRQANAQRVPEFAFAPTLAPRSGLSFVREAGLPSAPARCRRGSVADWSANGLTETLN